MSVEVNLTLNYFIYVCEFSELSAEKTIFCENIKKRFQSYAILKFLSGIYLNKSPFTLSDYDIGYSIYLLVIP